MPSPSHPAQPTPPVAAEEEVCALLHEVCLLASNAISVARERPDIQYEEDELHARIRMLRQTMDRIGWVADVALRKLGDTGSFERAEDWMLPQG